MDIVKAEDLSGLLWAFIIVGSIIAKVVGAAREKKSATRNPSSQTAPPTAASSELRNFLEQLSGTPQPMQPTPPPVIVRQPPQIKPAKPATKPPPPPPKSEPIDTVKNDALPRPQATITGGELAAMFGKSPAAAQRAIVLAEVLGKPLAMRESPSSL